MELKRKCCVCYKELSEFEGHPETISHPGMPGFNMPSGGVQLYCDKCHNERMEGYKLMEITVEKADKKQLFEKILARVKTELEKEAREIRITKEEEKYRIRYRYK